MRQGFLCRLWVPKAQEPALRGQALTGESSHAYSFHPTLQVLDLISSDSLNVPSEEEVYRAVLSWVKHDVDSRRQHVPRVSLLGKVTWFYPPAPTASSGWVHS